MSVTRCPSCGRDDALLVEVSVPFVVHTRGQANFHLGSPWGDVSRYPIPDTTAAFCNALGCNWYGKLREAISELTVVTTDNLEALATERDHYREALQMIRDRPKVERNPDGVDQAAWSMALIAKEALDGA